MPSRVIFFGTPFIAVSCLKALLDENINVIAVVTKPDMVVGRKQQIQKSAIHIFAEQHQIKILQPKKLEEIHNTLVDLKPDLFVVCAYGKILDEKILNIPKYHCINVHTSLLPRWRGGAPIHYAILNGDKHSGVSLMFMTKELDAGNVIYQASLSLSNRETYRTLYNKLSGLAYQTLRNKIKDLFKPNIKSVEQDVTKVTFARNITRLDEKINWSKSATIVDQQIRGLYDEPIAYTTYNNINIKIYESEPTSESINGNPGSILTLDKNGIRVICGQSTSIYITKLQFPGKRPVLVKNMINGNHPFKIGTKFSY